MLIYEATPQNNNSTFKFLERLRAFYHFAVGTNPR